MKPPSCTNKSNCDNTNDLKQWRAVKSARKKLICTLNTSIMDSIIVYLQRLYDLKMNSGENELTLSCDIKQFLEYKIMS